jgi:hypothetical protein
MGADSSYPAFSRRPGSILKDKKDEKGGSFRDALEVAVKGGIKVWRRQV